MKAKIKVTNGRMFQSRLTEVELSISVNHKGEGMGDVRINWIEQDKEGFGEVRTKLWSGQFGPKDFEEEFGFIIEPDKEAIE